MTDQQQTESGPKSLYQITGDIADINTILVNRGEFHRLQVDLERERMRLFACGVVAMADTPDSAREARAMHPDYESASCDDVKRRVDECIELRARVAELEDVLTNLPLSSPQRLRARIQRLEEMLAAVGAGGVGPLIPTAVQHQREPSSDNELQRKTGDLITAAAPPQTGGIPPDWKLVPVKPTRGMLDAARKDLVRDAEIDPMLKGIHSAMLAAAPQPPMVKQQTMSGAMRDFIEGMSVSVDVSTGEHDAGHRYFGTVTEVMDAPEDKHGVTLLVQDAEPNFKQPQGEQKPVAVVDFTTEGWREIVDALRTLPDGAQLCTRPQPRREPLENEQARRIYNSATYSASLAVFMTRIDAEHPDADDKGVSGWLQEAEDRVKHRTIDAAHEIGQAAAPQQGEQEPVAWIENVEGAIGYNPYHEAARKLPDGVRFDLYAHPQNLRCKSNQARLATLWGYVKAEPLTDEQIAAATGARPGTPMWLVAVAFTRAIERAHGIGGEA